MNFLFFLKTIKKNNLFFLSCILALQVLGLLSLYSAAYGADGSHLFLFKKQLLWFFLSWVLFFIISYSQIHFIAKILWPLFFLNMLALVLALFVGEELYGAKRWLDLGWFHYQPSETLKWVLILLLAKKLAQKPVGQVLSFKDILPLCFLILPPVFLIFSQPDLGTAGIILLMTGFLILFNGIEKKVLFSLSLTFFISTPLVWQFLLKPYQKARVISFVKPTADPQGSGYNVIQSKIAIGSGQFFGKGFRKGTQNKLEFLPERHTDFIFSVLSEEYGFVGSSITLILFFLMIAFIFKLAGQSRDRLNCYFCLGTGAFFLWHTVLNLAMTVGFFPVVGIPLPLFSYGGSHTLTAMAFLGLIASVYKNKDLF